MKRRKGTYYNIEAEMEDVKGMEKVKMDVDGVDETGDDSEETFCGQD